MMTTLVFLLLGQGVPTDQEARKAEERLASKLDDQAANLTMGRYLGFVKGDWAAADPFVQKSSDQALKKLSAREAGEAPKAGPEIIDLGDEWIAYAGRQDVALKAASRERAVYWYAKAWPLVDGIWKIKLRERFRKITSPPAGSDKSKKSAGNPYGWSGYSSAYLEACFAHSGMRSMRLIPSQSEKNTEVYSGFHSKAFPVSPGAKVRATAWSFTDGTDRDSHIDIRFFDSAGKFLGQRGPIIPQDSPWWHKVAGEVEAPAESFRVDIQVSMTAWQGTTWIDDLTLEIDGRPIPVSGDFEK